MVLFMMCGFTTVSVSCMTDMTDTPRIEEKKPIPTHWTNFFKGLDYSFAKALESALDQRSLELVEAVLIKAQKKGIDIKTVLTVSVDSYRNSMIYYALLRGCNLAILKLLKAYGADTDILLTRMAVVRVACIGYPEYEKRKILTWLKSLIFSKK